MNPGLVVVPPPMNASRPLYELETDVATFAETAEVVPPEQEQEFLAEFSALILAAREKRDALGHVMATIEAQVTFADAEIQRLQLRKAACLRTLDKLEAYLVRIIESLGPDAKGKPKKLEGNTVTFQLRKLPPSVSIHDEAQIPLSCKTAAVSLKLPAEQWNTLLDSLDLETRALIADGAKVDLVPSKTAIKAAIESSTEVPGASIPPPGYRLERK